MKRLKRWGARCGPVVVVVALAWVAWSGPRVELVRGGGGAYTPYAACTDPGVPAAPVATEGAASGAGTTAGQSIKFVAEWVEYGADGVPTYGYSGASSVTTFVVATAGDDVNVAFNGASGTIYGPDGSHATDSLELFESFDGGTTWYSDGSADWSNPPNWDTGNFDPTAAIGGTSYPATGGDLAAQEATGNGYSAAAGFCNGTSWPWNPPDPVGAGFSSVEGLTSGYLVDALAMVLAVGFLAIGIVMLRRWMKRAGGT